MSDFSKERIWKSVSLRFHQHKVSIIKSWLTYDGLSVNMINPSKTCVWYWDRLLSVIDSFKILPVHDTKSVDLTLKILTDSLGLKPRYNTNDFVYLAGGAKTVNGNLVNRFLEQWKEKFCNHLITNPHKNFENILDFIIINPFVLLNFTVGGILWNLARIKNKQPVVYFMSNKKQSFGQMLNIQSNSIAQRYKIF